MDEIQDLIDDFGRQYNLLRHFAANQLLQKALNDVYKFDKKTKFEFKMLHKSKYHQQFNGDFTNIYNAIMRIRNDYHSNSRSMLEDEFSYDDDSYDGHGRRKSHFGFRFAFSEEEEEEESKSQKIETIRRAIERYRINNKYKNLNAILRKLNDYLNNIDNFDYETVDKFNELTQQCNRYSTWYNKYGEDFLEILIDILELRQEARNSFGFSSGTPWT